MTDLDRAIGDYNEAIRLDPKDASAYSNRGSAWGGKGAPAPTIPRLARPSPTHEFDQDSERDVVTC